jgi:beta-glucosidase/6-phospho-beta-glucosidase/beta-galactosidase
MFQDDPMLVYGTDEQVNTTLDTLSAYGVDRNRVSVFWSIVAPANDQTVRPVFEATDPAAYPQNLWAPYDRIVRAAAAHGMLVNFNLTSPIPRWAVTTAERPELQETFGPNTEEFGKFVKAVGTRYSGTYEGLPRVDYWSIWNEPNQAGWLTPQWSPDPRNPKLFVESAPSIYRNLVAAAWSNLAATGHGADTVLVGETAPQGVKDFGLSRPL